jgi:hypothetical protein
MQKPRVPEVRGSPGGRACPRGMPPSLGLRPRPSARHVPRFCNGAAKSFDGSETSTAARAARRAPSPPQSRGDTVLPFPIFPFVCERGAVKNTHLALLFFCSRRELWCPRRPPGPCQTPPRSGLTVVSSLRRLGGLGGVPAQIRAAAGKMRSPFGPSASHVCSCGDFPVACVHWPALDPCPAYPRAQQMRRCIYFVPARSLGRARPPRNPNS